MTNFKSSVNILSLVIISVLSGNYISAGFFFEYNKCSDINVSCSSDELEYPRVLPTRNKRRIFTDREEKDATLFHGGGDALESPQSQFQYGSLESGNCIVMPVSSSECTKWEFNYKAASDYLGSAKLETYPYKTTGRVYTGINLTLTDIRWTFLRIRYQRDGNGQNHFCREFHMTQNLKLSEIFYDCRWIHEEYEGTSFLLEYKAHNPPLSDAKKYLFHIPYSQNIERYTAIEEWALFLYVDVTELQFLTAKWQQAPSRFGVKRYGLSVFSCDELIDNITVEGPFEVDMELFYQFNTRSVPGLYHFEVFIISDDCSGGHCHRTVSSKIVVGNYNEKKTVVVGIIGCVVLIPLVLFILHIWRRQCQPPNRVIKLPAVLLVYSPSHASHVETMVALAEYLRNYCAVEALLDRLDIPDTETKDPFTWCNGAFARADFVMVVSSPPKCCFQDGAVRELDVDALQILKGKFSDNSSRPHFFSVLLPYCTIQDIPQEAKTFPMFKLMKDLDKMLWYIHNDGKFLTPIDSLFILIGPKLNGSKSDLKEKGISLLTAIRKADDDFKVCKCKKRTFGVEEIMLRPISSRTETSVEQ